MLPLSVILQRIYTILLQASSEHRSNIRNSSEDPSISSTHSTRHVSSNSRIHPRASNHIHSSSYYSKSKSHDKQSRSHDSKPRSHDYHHKTPKRKRSVDNEEDSAMWTEHVSSSGRVYYYNKKEDKSQWEKPKGFIKKYGVNQVYNNVHHCCVLVHSYRHYEAVLYSVCHHAHTDSGQRRILHLLLASLRPGYPLTLL